MGKKGVSLVYQNIHWYRSIMQLLYKGKYDQRFRQITPLILGKSVVELCFGDIKIAEYCISQGIDWQGFDVNRKFVEYAKQKGFYAECVDLTKLENLPKADTCIMVGSLYHFHNQMEEMLRKMVACAPVVILSEPVLNLTNRQDWLGRLAAKSARITGKDETFRFTLQSLLATLSQYGEKLNFTFQKVGMFNKDLILIIKSI